MRKYVFIGIGSFFGAIARYYIRSIPIVWYQGNIPLNTLAINISGSFLLALILTASLEVREFDPDIRLGLTTGFLGAFTTFSALCKETVFLLISRDYFSAVSYLTVSTLLGLGAAYCGVMLARKALGKPARGKNTPEESAELLEEEPIELERDVK
jgi:CrcB protein